MLSAGLAPPDHARQGQGWLIDFDLQAAFCGHLGKHAPPHQRTKGGLALWRAIKGPPVGQAVQHHGDFMPDSAHRTDMDWHCSERPQGISRQGDGVVRHIQGNDIDVALRGRSDSESEAHRRIAGEGETQGAILAGQKDPQGLTPHRRDRKAKVLWRALCVKGRYFAGVLARDDSNAKISRIHVHLPCSMGPDIEHFVR